MHSDFVAMLRALSEGGVRFLIVGGYAVMEYREPRFTKDLDGKTALTFAASGRRRG